MPAACDLPPAASEPELIGPELGPLVDGELGASRAPGPLVVAHGGTSEPRLQKPLHQIRLLQVEGPGHVRKAAQLDVEHARPTRNLSPRRRPSGSAASIAQS